MFGQLQLTSLLQQDITKWLIRVLDQDTFSEVIVLIG